MLSKRIGIALAGLLALLPATARAAETVVGLPVALPLTVDGTGLCIASAVSQNVLADFDGLNTLNYNGRINTFIEAHAADRIESVVHTLLDLSNNNDSGAQVKPSYGDFTSVMTPLCKIGGCDFIVNDTTTSFGSRLRGFLNVTDDMVNKPIHIGLFADDAVSITFFGKGGTIYPVTIRPPQLGAPTWRVTNTVKFQSVGLYPLEILYVEIVEHAALEVSYFIGDFADFERSGQPGTGHQAQRSRLPALPAQVLLDDGERANPYPDPDVCKQCDRQFVNLLATTAASSVITATRPPSARPATPRLCAAPPARPAAAPPSLHQHQRHARLRRLPLRPRLPEWLYLRSRDARVPPDARVRRRQPV